MENAQDARLGAMIYQSSDLWTIDSCALIHSRTVCKSELWYMIAPNLSYFSTRKIYRISNHQMVEGGGLDFIALHRGTFMQKLRKSIKVIT